MRKSRSKVLTPPDPLFLLLAVFRTSATYFTTLLPPMAGPGGGFDVPNQKPPPDKEGWDRVRGSPHSFASSLSPSDLSSLPHGYSNPTMTMIAANINAPPILSEMTVSTTTSTGSDEFSTPPLTPDDDEISTGEGSTESRVPARPRDSLDFLLNLSPLDGAQALPYAKSASICIPASGITHEGVVLELPSQPKAFYVDGRNIEILCIRELVVALMDLASEKLSCGSFVIVLEKTCPILHGLLHSLMYAGGTIVTKPPFNVDPNLILIGFEL